MTDQIQPGLDDDPLQVNDIIAEAAAVQQDVQALQAEVEAWQSETETWQNETDEASPSASNASAPRITPEQIETLKQRLSDAAAPKGKTTAAKKLPDPDA